MEELMKRRKCASRLSPLRRKHMEQELSFTTLTHTPPASHLLGTVSPPPSPCQIKGKLFLSPFSASEQTRWWRGWKMK